MRRFLQVLHLFVLGMIPALAIAGQLYQTDFPPEEFAERRARLYEHIGEQGVVLVPGAPAGEGTQVFRQSNTFYYLCGIETPHSYLLLDGRRKQAYLFLPHRNEGREKSSGKQLSAEDAELVMKLAGVNGVFGVEELAARLARMQVKLPAPVVYVPFSPLEGTLGSRDSVSEQQADIASDPWDGRPSRTGHFLSLLRGRFPSLELRDLSPVLDEMRMIKSPREIALIRRASEIAAHGIMEAMRSTKPGVWEYQLDGAARWVFLNNGARFEAYPAITGGGTNAFMGHYFRNDDRLTDGDLVLMDFAPDYRYYASDVTRMWPVNGKFDKGQRALCSFVLAYRKAFLKRLRAGVTADEVLDGAAEEMRGVLAEMKFPKEIYRKAAERGLSFRGHLQHPVGMTVHDVGIYRNKPLKAGFVFAVDPMIWVPEEKLYVRIEDTVVITEDGVENFTDFMPAELDEIETLMREDGIVQLRPEVED
jgi:Xaa-Pro aminopeptidase